MEVSCVDDELEDLVDRFRSLANGRCVGKHNDFALMYRIRQSSFTQIEEGERFCAVQC
jgi:hypothetical protein